jgi:Putative Flp pilus-assembly TadE/G-like
VIPGRRGFGDAGQAFPIYITAIAALLFLAVAYFAVGQAAATRNDGQGAADAAALAAANNARDQLGKGLLDSVLDPGSWGDLLGGQGVEYGPACAAAQDFASRNDADVIDCNRLNDGFKVSVRTRGTVGDSLVPGTENNHAEASATAVLKPHCSLKNGDDKKTIELHCDKRDWSIDPKHLDVFPKPSDLFSVHLVE